MTSKSLKGRKILVTAYDLEQNEHRGIAVYSKSLIHCLNEAGAEVWLLTEFFDKLSEKGLRKLPKITQAMIHNARILNSLALGQRERPKTILQRKFALARKAEALRNHLRFLIKLLIRPRAYRTRNLYSFRIQVLYDNPYLRVERLDYLECVTGIVSAPDLYLSSQLAADLQTQQPVRIDLRGFDALITTCPLNISPLNLPIFVQTIHDVIPLEFVAHNENPSMFSHRLQACMQARRLFVSHSTANKYCDHIQSAQPSTSNGKVHEDTNNKEKVIIQSPSLHFPSWLTEDGERIADLLPVSHLLREEPKLIAEKPQIKGKIRSKIRQTQTLTPYRYFLFNSSVEARKNLLFLAKAYAESDLCKEGIKLCVTGKLKKDWYSKALKEIVAHEPGIILTGYVDETSKLDLYLNALGLLSPSLVEGFGIPVLDGACLGMPTVASNCESHLEIQNLHDFADHVLCLDTLSSRQWAAALQALAGSYKHLANYPAQTRRDRIGRYCKFQTDFTNQLQQDLIAILN